MSAAVCVLAWVSTTTSVTVWAAIRAARSSPGSAATSAPVLLLRPCAGAEPALRRALVSSKAMPPRSAVRFLVADVGDAAHFDAAATVYELGTKGHDAELLVTSARGPNRKVDQLARALATEENRHSIVVIADSDVELDAATVAALIGPIARGEAHAAWAPPVETDPATLADRASQAVLDSSLHAFALLGALDPFGLVGKLFAIRHDVLERIGGFSDLVAVLGEDMEIAKRLHAGGYRVARIAVPARSLAAGRSWSAVTARYTRWISVIRAQRAPLLASYPLLLAAAPLQLLLALYALVCDGLAGFLALLLVLVARLLTAVLARRASFRSLRGVVLAALLADLLLLVAFARAVTARSISWRGVALRIDRKGALAEAPR